VDKFHTGTRFSLAKGWIVTVMVAIVVAIVVAIEGIWLNVTEKSYRICPQRGNMAECN
jgi:hypothetical protein